MPNWTPEQLEEVKKCRRSFKYFAETYLKITHPRRGLVPFKLYPFQERVIENFNTHDYCITKKFRQAGFTTLTCMWLMWKCIFYNDQRCMIVSKTDREATGVGKAQPLNVKILTPQGWITMGSLKNGDLVISEKGLPVEVIGIFPQGQKEVFRVKFSDGTSTRCCADHLWNIQTKSQKHRTGNFLTKPLKDFMHDLVDGSNASKWFVPVVQPVHFEEKELPIDPYAFGTLIGDGSFRNHLQLTTADNFILEEMQQRLPTTVFAHRGNYDYYLNTGKGVGCRIKSIHRKIRKIGLWGKSSHHKFIPNEYKYNSVENRLMLIRGLMDTDGYVNKVGHAEFNTSSKKLADDFCDVVRSLGGCTRVRKKAPAKYTYLGKKRIAKASSYRVTVSLEDINPFLLPRKANKYTLNKNQGQTKAIVSVEREGYEECQCISVDSNEGLYVTDDYIVTHNTIANAKRELPIWLQPGMGNDNDHEKEFIETNSVMWFYTPSAGRSKSLTYLAVDEAAFIPGMDEHWAALYPTLAAGGHCIIISTVNGMGNWYEQTYTNALEKRNEFFIVEVDWHEHPDYNNAEWERKTRGNLGAKKFAQEIEGSFLGSGETYIPNEVISDYDKNFCADPIRKQLPEWDQIPEEAFDKQEFIAKRGDDGHMVNIMLPNKEFEPGAMWIWENPKPGREYIIAADTAEGIGDEGDFSAFIIMDIANRTQVAEFYSNTIPPYKFAQILKGVGDIYNTALMVVENSLGPGQGVCERLQHTLSYENLYYTQTTTRDKPGLNMNKAIRPVCLAAMQMCMLNRIVKIRSRRLTRELLTFIYNNTKQRAEAMKNKHDDLVICLAAALHVSDVMNRDVPVFTNNLDADMDIITRAFNDDFKKLREDLEEGMFDDILDDTNHDEAELLPKVMFDLKRPNHKILREFGWGWIFPIIILIYLVGSVSVKHLAMCFIGS